MWMKNRVDPDQLVVIYTSLKIEKSSMHSALIRSNMVQLRPPDKSAYWKIIFLISHPKHMLWVLKRTVSVKRFF